MGAGNCGSFVVEIQQVTELQHRRCRRGGHGGLSRNRAWHRGRDLMGGQAGRAHPAPAVIKICLQSARGLRSSREAQFPCMGSHRAFINQIDGRASMAINTSTRKLTGIGAAHNAHIVGMTHSQIGFVEEVALVGKFVHLAGIDCLFSACRPQSDGNVLAMAPVVSSIAGALTAFGPSSPVHWIRLCHIFSSVVLPNSSGAATTCPGDLCLSCLHNTVAAMSFTSPAPT